MVGKEGSRELQVKAGLFNALGHPVRLLIVNLVRFKPRHGKELASILGLHPSTISHHLATLVDAGLLDSKSEGYFRMYSLHVAVFDQRLADLVRLPHRVLYSQTELGAYRRKVLETYLTNGRLVRIPVQHKARRIVLMHIARAFQPGLTYPEREVNRILSAFNRDVGSLRRELVRGGLLVRRKGIYRRREHG
jgi:hypothetical protein